MERAQFSITAIFGPMIYRPLAWLHQGGRGMFGKLVSPSPLDFIHAVFNSLGYFRYSLSDPPEAMSVSYAAAFLSNAASKTKIQTGSKKT
jgi:hypothetical protein